MPPAPLGVGGTTILSKVKGESYGYSIQTYEA